MINFTSKIIKGLGLGKTFGFPTINLEIPSNFDLKEGVYSCFVEIKNKKFLGALFYGGRNNEKSLEIHVILNKVENFEIENGEKVNVKIGEKIRDVKKFKSKEDLKRQIAEDVKKITN